MEHVANDVGLSSAMRFSDCRYWLENSYQGDPTPGVHYISWNGISSGYLTFKASS